MANTLLVVEDLSDWAPYYPSDQVISFEHYLSSIHEGHEQRVRVINLCRSYSYLSDGYYCSLLAEARNHHVIPSLKVINDLGKNALYRLQLDDLGEPLARALRRRHLQGDHLIYSYFGTTPDPSFQALAHLLFERFPCPLLKIGIRLQSTWEITELSAISPSELDDTMQTLFAEALDQFSNKVWRPHRPRKPARFDLAILIDPGENLPPSNRGALKKFIRAGREMGINVELITQQHYARLPEFDALFIRSTTAVDHATYRFAKKAEALGLVVIDDPSSILRCANKIYLADRFRTQHVPTPRTWILHRDNAVHLNQLEQEAGFPVVIKIPDGSFSRGIVKADNRQELDEKTRELFSHSALLLAQEFLYTEFDWRIGILNHKALYACRYFMVKHHWQIYRHSAQRTDSGDFSTLPTFEAPKRVLEAALKATHAIGDGFYGVDVKEVDGKGYVIEVNDNPSIDSGIEDLYLGEELYRVVMREFLRRLENRIQGRPNT